jgi:hypothetical protein
LEGIPWNVVINYVSVMIELRRFHSTIISKGNYKKWLKGDCEAPFIVQGKEVNPIRRRFLLGCLCKEGFTNLLSYQDSFSKLWEENPIFKW